MKIGINFLSFRSYQGTETVAKNIVTELIRLGDGNEYLIFSSPSLPEEMQDSGDTAGTVIVDINPENTIKMGLYQQLFLPFKLLSLNVKAFYAPLPSIPILYPGRKIITIYDCAYDRFSEFRSNISRLYIKLMYKAAKYWCDAVVTTSEFSKTELINLYHMEPGKIKVIYPGVPLLPDADDTFVQQTKKLFNIDGDYFMYIGNTRPRKNINGLLRAFQVFIKNHSGIKLVIAGRIDNSFVDVPDEITSLGLKNYVIRTDFISEKQKTALYKGAAALVFPSYYEGFGLPVLEAQSLGIPVLTSNTSSLPEIGGEGALYIDPYNINDIANGMEKLMDSEIRNELIKKGLKNTERFSWKRAALQLLNILELQQ